MSQVLQGLAAGAVGTAALAWAERLAARGLQAAPVFSPERIAARALTREAVARSVGGFLRATYGPALGLAWQGVPGWRQLGFPLRALVAGLGTFAFEVVAMPLAGATPPLVAWRPAEVALLLAQTLVFGGALAAAAALLRKA